MNKFGKLLTVTLLASTIISCAPKPNPHFKIGKAYSAEGVEYTPKIMPAYKEEGLASWYGDAFHSKLTADGELFDKTRLTAAHKTLPLPSIVDVTNMENGKKIKVRVNDRGPFVKGRIIDVSEAAAKELGFFGQGSAKVMVELDREASIKALDSIPVSREIRELIVKQYASQTMREAADVIKPTIASSSTSPSNQVEEAEAPAQVSQEQTATSNQQPSQPNQKGKEWVKTEVAEQEQKPKSLRISEALAVKKCETEAKQPSTQAASAVNSTGDFVQIASLRSNAEAEAIIAKINDLKNSKIEEAIVNGKKYFRVKIGGYASRSEAESALASLKARGYKDAFITK